MAITPQFIKECKEERRKNLAKERISKREAMDRLMADVQIWLRAESQKMAAEILDGLTLGDDFDGPVKTGILMGKTDIPLLDLWMDGDKYLCQHGINGQPHRFGADECSGCRCLLERELRAVLREVSRSSGFKLRLPRNGNSIVLSV